jgi:hypothetical protein
MRNIKFSGLILLVIATLIYADVVTETYAKINMMGGFGNIESSTKTEIKGLKKSDDATVKMTGGIMGALAGKPQRQVTITRLDKDVIWNVDHPKKSYTETPITSLESLPKAKKEIKGEKKEEKPEYEIIKSDFSVKNTGNKKDVNGFPCSEYVANWILDLMKIETKEKTKSTITITLWTTPKNDLIKGFETQDNAFNQQLMNKIGMKISPNEMKQFGTEFITSMFTMNQDSVNKKMVNLKDELQKIEGYPIVTEMSWTLEGDSTKAKQQEMTKEEEKQETEKPSGGLGGMLANALAPKGNKGEKKETGGTKPAFYSYIEVKSIKLNEVPENEFDIPGGYKLVK